MNNSSLNSPFFLYNQPHKMNITTDPVEEELNLGLSLDGRFGVDKSHKGLVRSSSVAEDMSPVKEALVRTTSLPPVMEEEWRKRKEIQSLRRLEAKRKRSEKQRNGLLECLNSDPGLPKKPNPVGVCGDMQGLFIQQPANDCSSSKSSDGGASESEKNTNQGSSCGTKTAEVSSKKEMNGSENGMGDMPCVFTIGDGPLGRKVEGILYRYKKGEEVRIMCVCHGSFFTPAEFVNHAGARNVAHPLKRIVVNPNPSPFS